MLDACLDCGFDGGRMLLEPLSGNGERVRADHQQAIDPLKCCCERRGVVKVGVSGIDALGG
jgi:hypothetical protein